MKRSIVWPFLLGLCLLLLAGCGYNGTTTSGPAATFSGPPATATAILPPPPPNVQASGVTVQLSARGYHAHDTIVVTISNGTSQAISFADHQSNCTVVLLQQQRAASWESINACKLMTLTRFLSLKAGQSTTATLRTSGTTWSTGTYRVAFSYRMGSSPAAVAYSPLFQIS